MNMFRLVLVVLCLCSPWVQAAERLMLWEAKGVQGTVYLFGSIHVCKASCFPLDPSITTRLAASDALVLEIDPTRAEVQNMLLSAGMMPPGESLQSKLASADWQSLKRSLTQLSLPIELAARFRPWMVGALMSLTAAQQAGLEVSQGVDLWMYKRAGELGKPVLELETAGRQIAAISSGSEQEQMDALRLVLEQQQSGRLPIMLDEMRQAWSAGDSARLERLVREGIPAKSAIAHELIEQRNAEMTEKLLTLQTPSGRTLFVVVGAAHLVGSEGIVAHLSRMGFSVRQLGRGE